jgi:hypothetical protein
MLHNSKFDADEDDNDADDDADDADAGAHDDVVALALSSTKSCEHCKA